MGVITQMTVKLRSASLLKLGLDKTDWLILIFSILILFIVDVLHEKNISVFELTRNQPIWLRWMLYLGLIWETIMLGIYGSAYDASTFIYFQF